MNNEKVPCARIRQLIDSLDELLDVAGLEKSNIARAKFAISLCDHLGDRLDGERLAAVSAARDYWLRGKSVEYRKWFDLFSLMMDNQRNLHSIDRLVWGALAQSGGLDAYTGEYLVLEAFDAGLEVGGISAAIAEVLPDFPAG